MRVKRELAPGIFNWQEVGAPTSRTLAATVTAKVGCFVDYPDVITYTRADDGTGGHIYSQSSECFKACSSYISCTDGVPQWQNQTGTQRAVADKGFIRYPFAAVFHVDDGAGNSATITAIG